jgi:hypothetical protein
MGGDRVWSCTKPRSRGNAPSPYYRNFAGAWVCTRLSAEDLAYTEQTTEYISMDIMEDWQ